MTRVCIIGAGAGGAAAAVELTLAGHAVRLWNRSPATLEPFRANGGIAFEGVLGEGIAKEVAITGDIGTATEHADAIVVCLPTFSHRPVAQTLAREGIRSIPVVLNPGHTGGALEFAQAFREIDPRVPPIAEFSTLTYVARKYAPHRVTVTGRARQVRAAALPGGEAAIEHAIALFPGAKRVRDVLACDLANVNMVLHAPGAVLGAAWVEAMRGDFTFYVQGMTPGVARVMATLDAERLAVARAFDHELPSVIDEMKAIGTVEEAGHSHDLVAAISGGRANQRIKAPDSLAHRYYREDFGHGLLPFVELASVAGIDVPTASALLHLGSALTGQDFRAIGRTAATMGIDAFTKHQLIALVRDQ